MENKNQAKSRLANLFPGFVRYRNQIAIGAGIILGLIFIASGIGKIIDPTAFRNTLLKTALLSWNLSVILAYVIPWLELVLGICLALGIMLKPAAGVSFVLIMGFIAQNILMIKMKLTEDNCGCFGGLEQILELEKQLHLSAQGALYMDVIMLILTLIILFGYTGIFFTLKPWFIQKSGMTPA